ncbi:MAG: hypothetical protein AAFX87_08105 [Bacteroidota bacterium]
MINKTAFVLVFGLSLFIIQAGQAQQIVKWKQNLPESRTGSGSHEESKVYHLTSEQLLPENASGSLDVELPASGFVGFVGLSEIATVDNGTAEYGISIKDNRFSVLVNGQSQMQPMNFLPDDVIKIDRSGGVISFFMNGHPIFIIENGSRAALAVDLVVVSSKNDAPSITTSF